MSNYVTAIGLDVHAGSISACAFDPMTVRCPAQVRIRPRVGRRAGTGVRVAQGGVRERPDRLPPLPRPGGARRRPRRGRRLQDAPAGRRPRAQERPARRRVARQAPRLPAASSRCGAGRAHRGRRGLSRALEDARDDLQRARQRMSSSFSGTAWCSTRRRRRGAARSNWTRRRTGGGRGRSEFDEADDAAAYGRRYTGRGGPLRRGQEGARAQGGRGRLAPRAGADGRRAAPGGGRRRRHRVPARRRGGRLLEVPERAVVRRVVRARALGALERRDRVPRRDRPRGELPREARARRGVVARADVDAPPQEAEAGPRSRGGVEARRGATAACRTGATPCRRREKRPCVANCATAARWPCEVWAIAPWSVAPAANRSPTRGARRARGRWTHSSSFFWAAGDRHARHETAIGGPQP